MSTISLQLCVSVAVIIPGVKRRATVNTRPDYRPLSTLSFVGEMSQGGACNSVFTVDVDFNIV